MYDYQYYIFVVHDLRCVWLWHSVVSSFVYDCWILFSVLCMIISIISSLCMTVGKCCLVILCMVFAYCYLYWVYDCQFYVFAVYACGMVLYLYCVWLLDRWLLIVGMIIGYCFRFVGWFSVLHLRCVYDSAVSLLSVIVGYCLFIVWLLDIVVFLLCIWFSLLHLRCIIVGYCCLFVVYIIFSVISSLYNCWLLLSLCCVYDFQCYIFVV